MLTINLKNRRHTFIEIMLVLFITVISFHSLQNKQSLDKQVDFIKSLIIEARQSALNSKNGRDQKIIFSTSSIALNEKVFDLENNIQLRSYSMATNTIIFYRVTGLASATGTIEYVIRRDDKDFATSSIMINALGIIE